jgi:hypothetical protein
MAVRACVTMSIVHVFLLPIYCTHVSCLCEIAELRLRRYDSTRTVPSFSTSSQFFHRFNSESGAILVTDVSAHSLFSRKVEASLHFVKA